MFQVPCCFEKKEGNGRRGKSSNLSGGLGSVTQPSHSRYICHGLSTTATENRSPNTKRIFQELSAILYYIILYHSLYHIKRTVTTWDYIKIFRTSHHLMQNLAHQTHHFCHLRCHLLTALRSSVEWLATCCRRWRPSSVGSALRHFLHACAKWPNLVWMLVYSKLETKSSTWIAKHI